MIKNGFWKNKKSKIFPKLLNTTFPPLFMMQEGLLNPPNSMIWLTVPKIINFGVKLQEPKVSFGWQTIQSSHLLYKKLVQEFIINWTYLGGVRFQKSIGVKLRSKEKMPSNLYLDFGTRKLETKETNLYLFLKIWKDNKLRPNLTPAWLKKVRCKTMKPFTEVLKILLRTDGKMEWTCSCKRDFC